MDESWTRAGLFESGSGRDFQIISGFFRVDIRYVNAKYFLSFFKIFMLHFLADSVFYSKHSLGLLFFILQ